MPKTVEEDVYEILQREIVSGALPCGEFLSQRKLGDLSGASVISVRAALRRLENEGLVENIPQWGVRIPADTPATVRDRYFMRETLELAAVRRIAGKLTNEQAGRLADLAVECDRLQGDDSKAVARFAESHLKLHLAIAAFSGSPLLEDALRRLNLRSMMLMNAQRGWGKLFDREPRHHQDLVNTLIEGDTRRAANAMRSHIRRGLQHELDALTNGQ